MREAWEAIDWARKEVGLALDQFCQDKDESMIGPLGEIDRRLGLALAACRARVKAEEAKLEAADLEVQYKASISPRVADGGKAGASE